MSIKVMSLVWDESSAEGSELLLLLAIADHAHDDGTGAWPSRTKLAKKIRQGERNVQHLVRKLERRGELSTVINGGPHGCNAYTIHLPSLGGRIPVSVEYALPDEEFEEEGEKTFLPLDEGSSSEKGGSSDKRSGSSTALPRGGTPTSRTVITSETINKPSYTAAETKESNNGNGNYTAAVSPKLSNSTTDGIEEVPMGQMTASQAYKRLVTLYTANIGKPTPQVYREIQASLEAYSPEWVEQAITIAAGLDRQRRNWRYIAAILQHSREQNRAPGSPRPKAAVSPPVTQAGGITESTRPKPPLSEAEMRAAGVPITPEERAEYEAKMAALREEQGKKEYERIKQILGL